MWRPVSTQLSVVYYTIRAYSSAMAAIKPQVPPYTTLAPGFHLWRGTNTTYGTDGVQTSTEVRHPQHPGPSPKPATLVLLFTWLYCKPSNASKYASLYISRGCHVLQISSQLSHFLWPPNSRYFAEEIIAVLKTVSVDYKDFIVHAMSIGAYNFTTCLMVAEEKEEMKKHFLDKVRGIVFDSLTLGSLGHMVNGIATGISQWAIVHIMTKWFASIYLSATHKTTVDAFSEGVEFFKSKPLQVPTLVFGSRDDPMCDFNALHTMVDDWKVKNLFPITSQVWERSGHCAHLIHHDKLYKQLLNDFLTSLHLELTGGYHDEPVKILSRL